MLLRRLLWCAELQCERASRLHNQCRSLRVPHASESLPPTCLSPGVGQSTEEGHQAERPAHSRHVPATVHPVEATTPILEQQASSSDFTIRGCANAYDVATSARVHHLPAGSPDTWHSIACRDAVRIGFDRIDRERCDVVAIVNPRTPSTFG